VVIAVNIGESADQIRDYMLKHKLTFPALVDTTSRVANLYGVRATPTRFLIQRDGKAIAGSIGPRDWSGQDAQRLIETLLDAGKTPYKR
jgi:peroxiredoxin